MLNRYGYKDKTVAQCHETIFPSSNPGNFTLHQQADYAIGNVMHSLAWKVPAVRFTASRMRAILTTTATGRRRPDVRPPALQSQTALRRRRDHDRAAQAQLVVTDLMGNTESVHQEKRGFALTARSQVLYGMEVQAVKRPGIYLQDLSISYGDPDKVFWQPDAGQQ